MTGRPNEPAGSSRSGTDASRTKQVGTSAAGSMRRAVTVKGAASTRSVTSALPSKLSPENVTSPHDRVEETLKEKEGSPATTESGDVSTSPLEALKAQAGRFLHEAKDQLEQSGNIKTSIKETTIASLTGLYQIVLRLEESRRTSLYQLEKQKGKHQEELLSLKNEHIRQMTELTINTGKSDSTAKVDELQREVEALRKIVELQVVKPIADLQADLPSGKGEMDYKELLVEMGNMGKDLEKMRKEIRAHREGLINTTEGGVATGALEKVAMEVRALRQERRTYAETLRASAVLMPPPTQYTVIVKSKDPIHTAEEVLQKVGKAVNVREEGIRIDRCRKAKDGKVVIGCSTADDVHKLSGKLRSSDLTVEEAKPRMPLVEIRNVLAFNTDEEIVQSINKQNPHITGALDVTEKTAKVRFRRKARNPLEEHIVLEVSPKLWRKLTEAGKLYVGMQRREVVDRSPLVQCSACLAYGHTRRLCQEQGDTCAYCAAKHERGKCEARQRAEPPLCVNCAGAPGGQGEVGAHTAFSEECPARRKWDAIARSRVAYC